MEAALTSTRLTPSRALRRPRRIDLRAIFGIALFVVAVGGSILFWTLSSDARAVLVATRDLPALAVLTPSDLTVAHVRVDDAIYQSAIPADELSGLVGKPLAEPVHAQQLLVRSQVASRPAFAANQVIYTIPIAPENAVGGRLAHGNFVEVLVTLNKGKPDTQTNVVLPRAMVYDIGFEQRFTAINADSGNAQGAARWLSLVVSQDEARQLAQARWSGDLDVALLPAQR